MDNGLILFSSYKMSDIMSDKFLGQRSHRTKRIDAKCLRGRERPTDLLGGSSAKSGVAPARFGLFCAVTSGRRVVANP